MTKSAKMSKSTQIELAGQFLIAMPGMTDTRFERSVVFICTHSEAGTMGVIVNKVLNDITFDEILQQIAGVKVDRESPKSQQVWFGGPVEPGRGLVLHTSGYKLPASLMIGEDVLLTASNEILKDISVGKGPSKSLLALGYAGWGAGQLENEILHNSWLTSNSSVDILFEKDPNVKYDKALHAMGIDPTLLSADAGHA